MFKMILILSFLILTLIGFQAQANSFQNGIQYYNKNFKHAGPCFSQITNIADRKLLKKIIESNKISRLPSLKKNKEYYVLKDENITIKINNKSAKKNQLKINGYIVKLPAGITTKKIRRSMKKINKNNLATDKSTLYISCIIKANVFASNNSTNTASNPKTTSSKISEYNANSNDPIYFANKIKSKQDKAYYKKLIKEQNITELPKIVKIGNKYQMKLKDIVVEFDQQMIKAGKIKINNKIVNLNNATNAEEISKLIQRAYAQSKKK